MPQSLEEMFSRIIASHVMAHKAAVMGMDPLPTPVIKAENPNKTQHPVDFNRMLFN
jgi:hypothetical protein